MKECPSFSDEEEGMAEVDLEKMTATEMRDYALKNHPDVTGVHAMKKEELIVAIKKARGEEVKEAPKKKKAVGKVKADKKTLKKKIRELKAEKEKILQSKDRKTLAKIRKKIKKLKRMTKRAVA
jgi:protein-arginine kinase activator protein McsA